MERPEEKKPPTSLWQGRLELSLPDAILVPGETGQQVNSACVWLRLDGGPWRPSGHRSLHRAVKIAESFADPEEAFADVAPGLGPLNGVVSPWDIVGLLKDGLTRKI